MQKINLILKYSKCADIVFWVKNMTQLLKYDSVAISKMCSVTTKVGLGINTCNYIFISFFYHPVKYDTCKKFETFEKLLFNKLLSNQ